MALPAAGNSISLKQTNVELGLTATAAINMGGSAVRGLFGVSSGAIDMSDGFGKSSQTILSNAGNINSLANRQQITVSDYIDAGGTLKIPSNFYVWSDANDTPAMIIDIACTIINEGFIIGKGGQNNGTDGGPAIKISDNISNVTITNASGAYIAGGGGGGGQGQNGLGGGGAGGGGGVFGDDTGLTTTGGGIIGAVGDTSTYSSSNASYVEFHGDGGGAGGGGGGFTFSGGSSGGGGGRILPGEGGDGARGNDGGGNLSFGGNGGSANNPGADHATNNPSAGGGGGWGAAGGAGFYQQARAGGAAGVAIDPNSNSYTLSNSGTLYGATS